MMGLYNRLLSGKNKKLINKIEFVDNSSVASIYLIVDISTERVPNELANAIR